MRVEARRPCPPKAYENEHLRVHALGEPKVLTLVQYLVDFACLFIISWAGLKNVKALSGLLKWHRRALKAEYDLAPVL